MTPASHLDAEIAGNPGSNPGGRTMIEFALRRNDPGTDLEGNVDE